MALKSSLSLITRRIGGAVKTAAARFSLLPDEYALAGTFDDHSDRISLTIGTDRSIDDRGLYSAVLDEIERSLPEIPHINDHIGIVIRNVRNLDDIYLEAIGEGDELDLSAFWRVTQQ